MLSSRTLLVATATLAFVAAPSPRAAAGQSGPPSASEPAGSVPYRAATALLRLDVSVIDQAGRSIPDLRPADFQVEIDGRARKVLFADFTASERVAAAPVPSYLLNTSRLGGRAVAVLVDLESIRAGAERPLLDTAARLVESLRAVDAVSLVPIQGRSVPFTREHKQIAEAIRALRGTSNVTNFRHWFTFEEALAYERGDKRTIDEVVERECSADVEAARAASNLLAVCPPDLIRETRERLFFERQHIDVVLAQLLDVAQTLRAIEAPSTILLISGGMGFDQTTLGRYQQVADLVKQSGALLYSIQLDQPDVDASASRRAKTSTYSSDRQAGLANIATMSGGAFFDGIGRAAGVFERLRTEIAEPYLLGIEVEPGDLAEKGHDVRVVVARPNVTVRSRAHLAAPPSGTDVDARLAGLLAQPVDLADLSVAAAAYTVRGRIRDGQGSRACGVRAWPAGGAAVALCGNDPWQGRSGCHAHCRRRSSARWYGKRPALDATGAGNVPRQGCGG